MLQGTLSISHQVGDAYQRGWMGANRIDLLLRLPEQKEHEAGCVDQSGNQCDLGMIAACAPQLFDKMSTDPLVAEQVAPEKSEGSLIGLDFPGVPQSEQNGFARVVGRHFHQLASVVCAQDARVAADHV